MAMIFKEAFGTTKAGIPVDRYSMTNQAGMQVDILTYGAAIQKILIPVGDGRYTDVALGYNTLEDYENGSSNHGAFVGRYANRIKDASFTLDGVTYRLEANDGPNHLHGTYIRTVFGAHIENGALIMEYTSPDGEEGYPGTLQLKITYTLDEDNTLRMVYEAETDKATVINLTNHTYFNLRGQDGSTCADTVLTMQADAFAEGSAGNLPTGRFLPVDGTPMDFRKGRRIGDGLDLTYEQIRLSKGYDHSFVLETEEGKEKWFASAEDPASPIRLDCWTTQPGVQLYTGNYVHEDNVDHSKAGGRYPEYGAFCLETQHHPCSPNYPQFPSAVLRPGEKYCQSTAYRFTVK